MNTKRAFQTLLLVAVLLGATGLMASLLFPGTVAWVQQSVFGGTGHGTESVKDVIGKLDPVSITDIASSYYGQLTRPLWPDSSLGLPMAGQTLLSLVLMIVMMLAGFFFPKARSVIMALTILCVVRHLVWRGVYTLNFESFWLGLASVVIYAGELFAFASLVFGYFQIFKPNGKDQGITKLDPDSPLPSVAVMVCTYNEPVSVLYRTLVGCNNIDYPNKSVYLLDDGNRPEMAQLAQHLGVHYISRSNNAHAKAGNLNNALANTESDLVLVFDADHVPCRTFLNEIVGYFQRNQNLSFVQTPQHFFTKDPFQRNLVSDAVVNNEQDFFFHVIQPGNDYWGATFFAGSGAVFRRKALDDVGGFAVDTITEDVHTGLRLHARGWESAYYNKNLAAGLAQDSFADFVKQRLRWSRGMAQILSHDNPMVAKGLNLGQRLCYMAGITYFFNGLYRFVFLIAPLFFLLFGLMTINASFLELFVYYTPSFLCLFWGYSLLTNGYRHVFWAEIYETALCVYMTLSAIGGVVAPKRTKFGVTPKGTISEGLHFNWQLVVPQMLLILMTLVGLGLGIMRSVSTPGYLPGILTNVFWSVYNLLLLVGAIYVAQERPQIRLTPRVNKKIRCELRLLDGTIAVGTTTNLSENGMALAFDEPVPVAGTMALKLLDWDGNETSVFSVQAVRSAIDDDNRHYVGVRVVNRSDEQHQKLVRHMFGSSEIWQDNRQDTSIAGAFWALVATPMRINAAEEVAYRRRTPRFAAALPCLIEFPHLEKQAFRAETLEISETGLSLAVASSVTVAVDQPLRVQVQWANGHISDLSTVVKRVQPQGNGQLQVGVNFVNLPKAQRLEVIQQIYGPREGLIRVAPSNNLMVPVQVMRQTGETIIGRTQEMSEMGVRLFLEKATTFYQEEVVTVRFKWEDGHVSQHEGVLIVPDLAGEQVTTGGVGRPPVLVYFRNMGLQELDALSLCMHREPFPQVI
jgi:cellulose synthase (UDP-forming)